MDLEDATANFIYSNSFSNPYGPSTNCSNTSTMAYFRAQPDGNSTDNERTSSRWMYPFHEAAKRYDLPIINSITSKEDKNENDALTTEAATPSSSRVLPCQGGCGVPNW